MNGDTTLQKRLHRIEKVFDTHKILSASSTTAEVRKYYDTNALAFQFLHNRKGAVHMALSAVGEFAGKGVDTQLAMAREVLRSMPWSSLLEIGMCKGYNLATLAKDFPEKHFIGLELSESNYNSAVKKCAGHENITLAMGDYHNLECSAGSFDVVLCVETLCFSSQLPLALSQIRRVLRPGGKCIVFDFYRGDPATQNATCQTAVAIAERSVAMATLPATDTWKAYVREAGFEIEMYRDLTPALLPGLRTFETYARWFYAIPQLARFSSFFLPQSLAQSTIAGYLLPVTMASGLHKYGYSVLATDG